MITVEIEHNDTVEWLSDGYTNEQALDNAEIYRNELENRMAKWLHKPVNVVWVNGIMEHRIDMDSDDGNERDVHNAYDAVTGQMANDMTWLPDAE